MKKFLLLLIFPLSLFCACAPQAGGYISVPMSEINDHMTGEYIIVDVRTQEEYAAGHIPGAVLLPNEDINEKTAAAILPNKDTKLLVYCRSGNRSKQASQKLSDMGYKNIVEIGGINDYKGEIEY